MHFRSAGGVVPMLCPGCCTLDDIPDWPARDVGQLKIVVGCYRCGLTFPVLPGEFKSVTLTALHNHRCAGPEVGNWQAVGEVLIARIGELGSEESGALLEAAWRQPCDEGADDEA